MLKGILSTTSDVSCMRFMALVSLFFGFGISCIGIYKGSDLSQVAVLAGVFIGGAFGGKSVQAFAERGN